MISGLAGVVVLYFPEQEELFRNIKSYLPFIQLLIVVDNTGAEAPGSIRDNLASLDKTIQYIANKNNEGIGTALNKAASIGLQHGFSWLLTMDQDSFFDADQAQKYFSFFQNNFASQKDIAVVAPGQLSENLNEDYGSYSETVSVITSGSLIQLNTWKETGGYNEKLFIDEVDHEYCYRARVSGYRIVQVNQVMLNHRLGSKKSGAYLGTIGKRSRTIHSPQRVYFMVRNYLYVRKNYRGLFPEEFRHRDRMLLVAMKNNLFFSGHFLAACKSIVRGFRDFRKGKFATTV
jgi:rhamnosyltransferase